MHRGISASFRNVMYGNIQLALNFGVCFESFSVLTRSGGLDNKILIEVGKKVYFLALCTGMKSNLQFLNHEHPEELSSGGSRYWKPDTLKLWHYNY
jgi:hypothetical protein